MEEEHHLTIVQRIRAMYRRYCRHKIHLVDDALERHASHLEGYLGKLTAKYGPEPILLYSYDVFPELLPAIVSSNGRATTYRHVTMTGLLDAALPDDHLNHREHLNRRTKKYGQVDQGAARCEALNAEEHRERTRIKNIARSFFFKVELDFSDERTLLQQKEHSQLLQEALVKEHLEDLDRKRRALVEQALKEERQSHESQINALTFMESKVRAKFFHQWRADVRMLRKKESSGLNTVQKAAQAVARTKILKKKKQIDGNATMSDEEGGSPAPRIPDTADPTSFGLSNDDPVVLLLNQTSITASASRHRRDRKQAEIQLPSHSTADSQAVARKRSLYDLGQSRRSEIEFVCEDCSPIRDVEAEEKHRNKLVDAQAKLKLRRLQLLNAKQREIIVKRMDIKRKARKFEQRASQRAAGEVQQMLTATKSEKGLNEIRERRQSRRTIGPKQDHSPEERRVTTLLTLPPVSTTM